MEKSQSEKSVEDRIDDMEHLISKIKTDVKETRDDVKAMREMFEAYNNGKSIFNAVAFLSRVAIWLAATGAALTAIYQAIRHFGNN